MGDAGAVFGGYLYAVEFGDDLPQRFRRRGVISRSRGGYAEQHWIEQAPPRPIFQPKPLGFCFLLEPGLLVRLQFDL